ncbi:MAG: MBL fold metallo-hydrolase [Prevotellaceae bacterium]|jgi:glyoxylase-like metal-dependent hydrolase (beta-lactamase superfamily II)|nr:MBL fold metallo-hydrolase [Prevotellaceae bacterium]
MKKIITLALAAMPALASAQQPASPTTFTHRIGAFEITVLPENQGTGNASILVDATPEMLAKAIPDGSYPNAVNAFLVKTPTGNILFDTGFGRNLTENLAAVGVKPADIGTLVITHMHGDHIGGMLRDGKAAFPNAKLVLADVEKQYWVDKEQNKGAVDAYRAYGKVELVHPQSLEAPLRDGLTYIAAYGHTPGHTAIMLQSDGQRLLIWGDLAHAMAVQMPYPQVSVRYDSDPAQAAEARQAILGYVAERGIPIAGMHVAFPGMGSIERQGNGFSFTPFK